MKTNTLPPKEIYDVLHKAEAKGIELPESVDKWWALETAINETPYCKKCVDKGQGICNTNTKGKTCPMFSTIKLLVDTTYK